MLCQSDEYVSDTNMMMFSSDQMTAFSCGVMAVHTSLSCGRRWLQVGGGCCQMMAPGGTMCEMKVGEDEIKKEAKKRRRGALTQQTVLPPPPLASRSQIVGDIDPRGAL